ncbi:unnamed protein product [Paramecium octaurelia]|uniref:Transmembrane protein n=1 Tax=Paramecium octaurelia TaxID=43137 RepID=A0A8S1YK06_PAROT|nr:unnamed protein product [Paramecium octaurelia]
MKTPSQDKLVYYMSKKPLLNTQSLCTNFDFFSIKTVCFQNSKMKIGVLTSQVLRNSYLKVILISLNKRIQGKLLYRISEILSQFNLALTLTIHEVSILNNQILFICLFSILNPVIILRMRFFLRKSKQIQIQKDSCLYQLVSSYLCFDNTQTHHIFFQFYENKMQSKLKKIVIVFDTKSNEQCQSHFYLGRIIVYRLIARCIIKYGTQSYVLFIALSFSAQWFRKNS